MTASADTSFVNNELLLLRIAINRVEIQLRAFNLTPDQTVPEQGRMRFFHQPPFTGYTAVWKPAQLACTARVSTKLVFVFMVISADAYI